jgi:hypothetical protein
MFDTSLKLLETVTVRDLYRSNINNQNNNNNNNNKQNVIQKETEKKLKYKNLSIEIQRM